MSQTFEANHGKAGTIFTGIAFSLPERGVNS